MKKKVQILEEAFKIPWTSQKMKEMTANYKSMESQDKLIPVKQRFKISYETEM